MGEAVIQETSESFPLTPPPNLIIDSNFETEPVHIVSLIVVNPENQILLGVKHEKLKEEIVSLVCVGHVENDETIFRAVCREAEEELGILIKNTDIYYVGHSTINGYKENVLIYHDFVLKYDKPIQFPDDNDEFANYYWADPYRTYDLNLSFSAQRAMKIFQKWEM